MQLQMTAPMDIGMEQLDAALGHGQEDVFDLGDASRGLRKKGGISRLMDESDVDSDEEEAGAKEDDESDGEVLDEDEERERKVAELENELDGLYDSYQSRLKERDSKYKVQEARRQNKEREEWHGIQEKGSDDESDSDDEGGWDKMEQAKARAGEDSSSDESDEETDDDEADPQTSTKKRARANEEPSSRSQKRVRLNGSLTQPPTSTNLSRAAQVWFSQDCFAGADLELDEDSEDDGDDSMDPNDESDTQDESDVSDIRISPF